MNSAAKIAVGDRVMYRREWLCSTGNLAGTIAHARGTVTGKIPFGAGRFIVVVLWDEDPLKRIPERVLDRNLSKVGEYDLG